MSDAYNANTKEYANISSMLDGMIDNARLHLGGEFKTGFISAINDLRSRLASSRPSTQPAMSDDLVRIADLIGSYVQTGQNSPDEPPDYCSQIDYDLAQCSGELRNIALLAAHPVQPERVALADCYSGDDGDTWHDCPSDIIFVNGRKVGDEFELLASVRAWPERFRVTKAPDDQSDDYEVEPVRAPVSHSDAQVAQVPLDGVARPDILEKLTYHKHECDDITLNEALSFLAEGWKKVHGRTERQMVFQIAHLLAAQPTAAIDPETILQMVEQAVSKCTAAQQHYTYAATKTVRERIARGDVAAAIDVREAAPVRTDMPATKSPDGLPDLKPPLRFVHGYSQSDMWEYGRAVREQDRAPYEIYLSDRADGCKGRYAICRMTPDGYREYWNFRSHKWSACSDEVLTLEQARSLLSGIQIQSAPSAQAAEVGK